MKRRGFTLIEMLVVIAILLLLAAILFPVFSRVREKGRSAVCLSNLRQLGQAMTMYIQDYERYPHAIDPADKYAPGIWDGQEIAKDTGFAALPMVMEVMEPYVKNAELWHCPSDSGFERPDSISYQLEGKATRPSCFALYHTSYFYRTELMFLNLSEDRLKEPTKTNVLFDAHGAWHGSGGVRRYNVLFADGHAKSLNGDQMVGAWHTPVQ